MKKKISILLVFVLVLSVIFTGCGNNQEESDQAETQTETTDQTETSQEDEEEVRDETEETEETNDEEAKEGEDKLLMATTTSTDNTGLLDELAQKFKEDTGIELEWVAVGTGEALKMGEDGEVDIVMVHSKPAEEEFVEAGYGVERVPIMYNDYVVAGPEGMAEKSTDALAFFQNIYDQELGFVSRGDDSGTHKKELSIWEELDIDPSENPNYIESGQGMGDTLIMAEETESLVLSDRATWISTLNNAEVDMENMEVLLEDDPILYNQYGVIAVSPEMYPEVNSQAAQSFIDWIVSDEVQEFIGTFGQEEFGQPLFVPNANEENV